LKTILSSLAREQTPDHNVFNNLPYDLIHPYSRTILYNDDLFEAMIARWTPGKTCAPHDHSDSYSAILVLEGCSEHKLYQLEGTELRCVHTEERHKGDVILCAPHQIHSMSAHPDLITLHFYTRSITNMLVFDLSNPSSFLVDGSCGAWLPVGEPSMIIASTRGHVPRSFFERACS
jgi:predicted metal-dependent enzyme (double-stranded beta helix superfamily)